MKLSFLKRTLGNCWKCFELQQDNIDTLNWLSNNTYTEETNYLVDVNHHPPLFHDAEKTFCDWVIKIFKCF